MLFWVGLVPLSVVFGDVFAAFSPWRAIGRGAAWIGSRVSKEGLPDPLPYPKRLGRWPAAVSILAFAWVELVYASRDDPSVLATLALAYAAIQLVGMSMYGVEAWTRNADGFGAYFGLFAKLSLLRWSREAVHRRRPLSGLTSIELLPGTVALLGVMIGTVSFDGFTGGPVWSDLSPDLTNFFLDLGLDNKDAPQAAFTVGLLAGPAVVGALYSAVGRQLVTVLAHAGHRLASLLYVVPIVVVVGALGFQVVRERRREAEEGPSEPEPPSPL